MLYTYIMYEILLWIWVGAINMRDMSGEDPRPGYGRVEFVWLACSVVSGCAFRFGPCMCLF